MDDITLMYYDMMGYPLPKEAEPFFWGGEKVKHLSYTTHEYDFNEQDTAYLLSTAWIWKNTPFLEAVYISGPKTFDKNNSAALECIIVCSHQRMRLCSARYKLLLCLQDIYIRVQKKVKKIKILQSTIYIRAYLDEQYLSCITTMKSHDDVGSVYMFAHLIAIYHAYIPNKIHIYEHNQRIQEYLPNFPLTHLLTTPLFISGKTGCKRFLEHIHAGLWGVFCEKVYSSMYILQRIYLGIVKRVHPLTCSPLQIWNWENDQRSNISIIWKMLRKTCGPNAMQQ